MLLLFDIDGTLLWGAGEHARAVREALQQVHGLGDYRLSGRVIDPAGRTDAEIARLILLHLGVPADRIDALADEVQDYSCRAYARLSPEDLTDAVLPGVPELLGWLSARDDVELALVTGNYEPIARIKLARAGLGRYFPAGKGAFGSDSEDRAALPTIARRRAGALGHPYPREQTLVIGDTPRDIACARADGVGCIAVATGPCHADELKGADLVVADAVELRKALEGLLAGSRA